MVGRGIGHLSARGANEGEHWRLLLQEGAWQGSVSRRTLWGIHVAADIRQYVRFHDDGTPRDVVEYGRRSLNESAPVGGDWHIPDRLMAASWEIDTSRAQQLIATIVALRRAGTVIAPSQFTLWCHELVQATRIINVNDRTARLVGGNRGRALMVGQSVATFWPIESRAILGALIVEAFMSETVGPTHRRQLVSDGILRDPVVTLWRVTEPERAHRIFVAVNGTADDDRSYLYLRASEARYRKLVHYMPIALLQVDASHMGKIYADLRNKGVADFHRYLDAHPELIDIANETVRVTDVNRQAVQMFGGTSPLDLIRPINYLFTINRNSLRNVMIGRFNGQQNHAELTRMQTLDGRIVDVQLSVTYPVAPLELDVTIFALEDVTARLQMEAQLRQLQADFTHAARISTLGELATSIAHEVNQPLAAIVTNAETSLRWLARADPNIAKVTQLTERIAASGRRANDIVQRIRGMAAKRAPERVALDLNEVAQEALMFIRHEVDSRAIRINTAFGTALPQAIGDRIQLQQVIVNLLINSVQAVEVREKDARIIMLETGLDDDGALCFSIRDTGPGIPPADLDRIFEGFFTTKDSGMGMGLAICQSIIAGHHGRIVAVNHPDGGAQFRFAIPAGTGAVR
ncbi:PAS domain-containing sensor histidine kinase [Sphingomonas oleivorans]|nr:ATP-binding protein [Sphingomonas oleivorans]